MPVVRIIRHRIARSRILKQSERYEVTESSFKETEATDNISMPFCETFVFDSIRSPKRSKTDEENSRAQWFNYYAGFSAGFVEDTLKYLNLRRDAVVLDPWLGAGTTAEVAACKGFKLKGYDLNPAMLLIARARTISSTSTSKIPDLLKSILLDHKKRAKKEHRLGSLCYDPLSQWLDQNSVQVFRSFELSVKERVRSDHSTQPLWHRLGAGSSLTSFFYLILFRTLRSLVSHFKSSNPTWFKVSRGDNLVKLSQAELLDRFQAEAELLLQAIGLEKGRVSDAGARRVTIRRASSLKLPIDPASVDAVISSPPYCTRIDYVKATLPELAVIGYPNGTIMRRLRDDMIGTPTMVADVPSKSEKWGTTCAQFLAAVESHHSKASSTYYSKYYKQYFASLFASLVEIDRVLKKNGRCVLVLQDSYYKGVHNDLPQIVREMTQEYGWVFESRQRFEVDRTLAGVNPRVKCYRTSFKATESVLVFCK